jgi:hypothetical protein
MIRPNFDLPKAFIEARARAASEAAQPSPSRMIDLSFGKTDAPSTPRKADPVDDGESSDAGTVKEASSTPSHIRRPFSTFHLLNTPLNVADDVAQPPTIGRSTRGMSVHKSASSLGLSRSASSSSTIVTPPTPSWRKKSNKKLHKKTEVKKKDGTVYSIEEPTEEVKAKIRASVKAAFNQFRAKYMTDKPEEAKPPRSYQVEEKESTGRRSPTNPTAVEAAHHGFLTQNMIDRVYIKELQDLLQAEEDEPSNERMTDFGPIVYTTHKEDPKGHMPDHCLQVQALVKRFERVEGSCKWEEIECAKKYEANPTPTNNGVKHVIDNKSRLFHSIHSSLSPRNASSIY